MSWKLTKDLGHFSRDFYEFTMPAIDMFEDGNDLVVIIDLPGFAKKDINLRIVENILYIRAKREPQEYMGATYYKHRPSQIDKKIVLPISTKDGEKVVGTAKYADNGVVTLRIPFPKSTIVPIT
jgi:HSP20 family molecular chaperone IbpA